MRKSYRELIMLPTYKERFDYLRIGGRVGLETFGSDRCLNQALYQSQQWRSFRDQIIIRDNGCDMAMPGYELHERIYIHHINPLTVDEVLTGADSIFDPDNAVAVCFNTHNAIHYGDGSLLKQSPINRMPNDTCPWR